MPQITILAKRQRQISNLGPYSFQTITLLPPDHLAFHLLLTAEVAPSMFIRNERENQQFPGLLLLQFLSHRSYSHNARILSQNSYIFP